MTVKYKLIKQASPGVKGGGDYKYYVRACEREKVQLDEIARILSQRSSLSRSDIVATLIGFVDLIPELLLDNRSVELDELGIFSLHMKSIPSDTPRVDSFRLIKSVQIGFRPSVKLKKAVRNPQFEKSKTSEY